MSRLVADFFAGRRLPVRLVAIFVGVMLAIPVLYPPVALYSAFADDFFFYGKVAKSISAGNGSTFGGIVATNGYHPLWQMTLVPLFSLAGALGIDGAIVCRLAIALIAAGAIALLGRYLGRWAPASPWRTALFLFAACYYFLLARTGMEIVLSTPLMILFLEQVLAERKNGWLIGLLAALVVLARLDAALGLIVFFLAYAALVRPSFTELLKIGVAGAAPVGAYLAINRVQFGSLMPVSGLAKSVLHLGGFNAATFTSLFNGTYKITNPIAFALLATIALLTLGVWRRLRAEDKACTVGAFLSTPLFYLQNSLRSDWTLWTWYYYPILFSLLMLAPVVGVWIQAQREAGFREHDQRPSPRGRAAAAAAGLYFLAMAAYAVRPGVGAMPQAGLAIREFSRTHPGVYAMGDQAGIVGYLLDEPMVQLEGLVMDAEYLRRFRAAKDLKEILDAYGVDYYVGFHLEKTADGKLRAVEPIQSRGRSARLTADLAWPVVYEAARPASLTAATGGSKDFVVQAILQRPADDPKSADWIRPMSAKE